YQNQCHSSGKFVSVEEQSVSNLTTVHGQWVSLVDYNNDGLMDLFFISEAAITAWENQGEFMFIEVTGTLGLDSRFGHAMAWGDYDNDGDLDLYVSAGWDTVNSVESTTPHQIIFSADESWRREFTFMATG